MDTILLLINDVRERRRLETHLKDKYRIIMSEEDDGRHDGFDLCICDDLFMKRLFDAVAARKEAEKGVFLPVLLVTTEKAVGQWGSGIQPIFNEVIFSPIKEIELYARVTSLLRTRHLSMELKRHNETRTQEECKSLAESETWFRSLFQNNHAPMLIVDPSNGAIVDANPAACTYYGWPREILSRMNVADINTLSPEQIRAQMHAARVNQRNYFEFKHRLANGAVREVQVYSGPVNIGERVLLYSLVFDITEQKRMEETLRQERNFNNVILESLPGVFYLYDKNLQFLRWNLNFKRVTGYSDVEIGRMSPLDFFAQEEKALLASRIQEVFDKGASSVEADFVSKDGTRTPYYFTGNQCCIDGKNCLLGVGIDISGRKEAEEKFTQIFQVSPTPMTITRISDGKFIDVNEAFLSVFEFSRGEVVGRTSTDLNILGIEAREKLIRRQIASGGLRHAELLARSKSGRPINLLFSSKPIMLGGEACHVTTLIDISELKDAETALRKSEERLRLSTEMAHVAVWEYDFYADSMERSTNHDLLYGLEWQSKWEFETFLNATHPEDREYSNRIIQESVAPGGQDHYQFDFRTVHPDRSVHWLSVTGRVVQRDAAGRGILVRGCIFDISDRKRTEEDLKAGEIKFRSFFENSMDAILLTVPDGSILAANPAAIDMFGFSEAELKKKGRQAVVDTGDPRLELLLARRAATGRVVGELTMVRKDGTRFPAEISSALFKNAQGLQRTSMIIRDITERKRAETEIQRRAEELAALNTLGRKINQSLFLDEVIPDSIAETLRIAKADLAFIFLREGDDMRMAGFGPQFEKNVLEKFPGHCVGECICGLAVSQGTALYSRDIFEDARCTWQECKQAGLRSLAALPLRIGKEIVGLLGLAGRTERDFQQQAAFLETLAGQIAAGLNNAIVHQKIQKHAVELEQRVAERTAELSVALEKSQETERLKSIFLASMSHELRTPLNSIIGFTGILLMGLTGELNPEQKKQLQMVKTNGQHLLSMINDILDISKIEAGKVVPEVEPFDLVELAKEVVNAFEPQIREKGISLNSHLSGRITVRNDRRRVKQILMNLTSNAVKYTEEGGVGLLIRKLENDRIEIRVSDTGIGIGKENLKRLFQPFQQVGLELTKNFEGTGLGLYLSQKLANLLGGEISVSSELGKGSVFTVVLPLAVGRDSALYSDHRGKT